MDRATLASNAAVHDETVEFHGVRAAAAAAAVISADRSHVQYEYTKYDSSGPSYFDQLLFTSRPQRSTKCCEHRVYIPDFTKLAVCMYCNLE